MTSLRKNKHDHFRSKENFYFKIFPQKQSFSSIGIKMTKIKVKNSVSKMEQDIIFSRYEKFLAQSIYSGSANFDKNTRVETGKCWRAIKIIFIKLLIVCFGLRCIANIFWPNSPLIQQLTCNGFHYLGNSPMLNLGMLAGVISGSLLLGSCQQYFILKGKSFQLQYINKIKYRRLDYSLNNEFNNKFFKKFNWISIWVYTQFIQVYYLFDHFFHPNFYRLF